MKKSIIDLHKQIDKCNVRIKKIQVACKHEHTSKVDGGDTGNYDPSSDRYWTYFTCEDCGRRWTIYYNTRGEICKTI